MRWSFSLPLGLTLLPLYALKGLAADLSSHYYDDAQVTAVTPQYQRVNIPIQECHTEYIHETYSSPSKPSAAGSIIGGIAGGLLGSTIGRGNGRVAAAAVGAGVGAIVGDRIDNDNNGASTSTRPVERCEMLDHWETQQQGYLVNYRYQGHEFTTVTNSPPGNTLRIRIALMPEITDPVYSTLPIVNHHPQPDPHPRHP